MRVLRRLVPLAIAAVLVACSSGVSLPSNVKTDTDDFWNELSALQRDALCEQMDTASGRLEAAGRLKGQEMSDNSILSAEDAEDSIIYLHDKC